MPGEQLTARDSSWSLGKKKPQQKNLKAPERAGVKPRQERSISSVAAGLVLSRAGGTATGQDPCCGRGAGPITTLSQGPSRMDRQRRPSGSEGGLLAVPCHPAPSTGSMGGSLSPGGEPHGSPASLRVSISWKSGCKTSPLSSPAL